MPTISEQLLCDAWINGEAIAAEPRFAVSNPATQAIIAEVANCDTTHTEQAVTAAEVAYCQWRTTSPDQRADALTLWADALRQNRQQLGALITSENGKPLQQAEWEIDSCISALTWYSAEARRLCGQTLPPNHGDGYNFTFKRPVGIVACITPWNFPAAAMVVKVGAALAAGCSCVVKPSEETPLIALALAQLATQAGLTPGLINVLPSRTGATVGNILCTDPRVRMLTFTGSTKTGQLLYQQCASTVKKLALELGGNAPFIVFADADLEPAVDAAINARFYNSGQICVGANRFFVQQEIYDEFLLALSTRVAGLTVGAGSNNQYDIGPQINGTAIEKLKRLISDATDNGATLEQGGQLAEEDSLFFQPTLLSNMTDTMAASKEEIFGPAACLYSFNDEDEVVARANNTSAGLAGYVFTRDSGRIFRLNQALECGMVGANTTNLFADNLPFGGIKQSGLGREHGLNSLDEFMETQSLALGY